MKRMTTKQARHSARCITAILRLSNLKPSERKFLQEIKMRIAKQRGYWPKGAERVLLEGLIEHMLTPDEIDHLRTNSAGSRTMWEEKFGRGFGA